MSDRSITHGSFSFDRVYDAEPARVFAAFADITAKSAWFVGPDEFGQPDWSMDFRVGGREVLRNGAEGGPVFTFDARYVDIVPDERIVYTYEMYQDDARLSVSVATLEFEPDGAGTRLVVTEQGAFLDGLDNVAQREQGTGVLLDNLGTALAKAAGA
jgi:uncharacterized protein YndB with AHSA1/START domain